MTDRTYTIFARGGVSVTVSTTTVTETTLTGGKVTAAEQSTRESLTNRHSTAASDSGPTIGFKIGVEGKVVPIIWEGVTPEALPDVGAIIAFGGIPFGVGFAIGYTIRSTWTSNPRDSWGDTSAWDAFQTGANLWRRGLGAVGPCVEECAPIW